MYQLYLVRQAQTRIDPQRPPSEWALDPAGRARLEDMAALPHWATAYRLISSDEPKAVRTAEAIARQHDLPAVETLPAVRELHKESFVADHDEVMAELFGHPQRSVADGWESGHSALSRFSTAAGLLVQEASGRDLVVVSHGVILALYLAHLSGQSRVNPAEWRAIGMPDYAVVDTRTMKVTLPFGTWRSGLFS